MPKTETELGVKIFFIAGHIMSFVIGNVLELDNRCLKGQHTRTVLIRYDSLSVVCDSLSAHVSSAGLTCVQSVR